MKIVIRPYIYIDGIPTFRNSDIKNLYRLMFRDKTVETVFYDGEVITEDQFLRHIQQPGTVLYVAEDSVRMIPVGIGWLNSFENSMARAHFCVFSEGWSDSLAIGKKLVQTAAEFPGVDTMVGVLPTENKRAIEFSKKCGAKLLGELPNGITILYYFRGELNG